jgi:DNA repair protein RecN (Recombination protein N)
MLCELKIKNLALIESLHLNLSSGLVVLTGETGAGKSIVLQAIHLLTGGRASASSIRTGADSASVEALFEIAPDRKKLLRFINDRGVETDSTLIIKRILLANGRSRYYINDGLVTAKLVGEIAENLVNIASQHDHQQLLIPQQQLNYLDTVGDLWPQRDKITVLYDQWKSINQRLEELKKQEQDKEQRRDYLAFQLNEISDAAIAPGEDEQLSVERQRLKSSETLLQLGRESYQLINDQAVDSLHQFRKNLEQMAAHDPSLEKLAEQAADYAYQVDDLADQLQGYCDTIPSDQDMLETMDARIDLLQRLKRKYGGPAESLDEVIAHAENCRKELDDLENREQIFDDLHRVKENVENELTNLAAQLTRARRETALSFAESMQQELESLSFDQALFEIRFQQDEGKADMDNLSATGWDNIEFMFSANPGEPVRPLIQVASGGELSRLMLALKCLLARRDQVETVIFDEVDAGIGGKAAEAVARKIKELSGHHQVICITHLPQIASQAEAHLMVSKNTIDNRTRTAISPLHADDRVKELARMLAGNSITKQTLAYAEELMSGKNSSEHEQVKIN